MSATWGPKDVTSLVPALYNGGERKFFARSSQWGGGDPAPGQAKPLTMKWRFNDVVLEKTINEGDSNGITLEDSTGMSVFGVDPNPIYNAIEATWEKNGAAVTKPGTFPSGPPAANCNSFRPSGKGCFSGMKVYYVEG